MEATTDVVGLSCVTILFLFGLFYIEFVTCKGKKVHPMLHNVIIAGYIILGFIIYGVWNSILFIS